MRQTHGAICRVHNLWPAYVRRRIVVRHPSCQNAFRFARDNVTFNFQWSAKQVGQHSNAKKKRTEIYVPHRFRLLFSQLFNHHIESIRNSKPRPISLESMISDHFYWIVRYSEDSTGVGLMGADNLPKIHAPRVSMKSKMKRFFVISAGALSICEYVYRMSILFAIYRLGSVTATFNNNNR